MSEGRQNKKNEKGKDTDQGKQMVRNGDNDKL